MNVVEIKKNSRWLVIDLCEGGNEEVNALWQDYLGVYVNFKISRNVLDEINRNSDTQKRQKHLAYSFKKCIYAKFPHGSLSNTKGIDSASKI